MICFHLLSWTLLPRRFCVLLNEPIIALKKSCCTSQKKNLDVTKVTVPRRRNALAISFDDYFSPLGFVHSSFLKVPRGLSCLGKSELKSVRWSKGLKKWLSILRAIETFHDICYTSHWLPFLLPRWADFSLSDCGTPSFWWKVPYFTPWPTTKGRKYGPRDTYLLLLKHGAKS